MEKKCLQNLDLSVWASYPKINLPEAKNLFVTDERTSVKIFTATSNVQFLYNTRYYSYFGFPGDVSF